MNNPYQIKAILALMGFLGMNKLVLAGNLRLFYAFANNFLMVGRIMGIFVAIWSESTLSYL